MRRICIAALVEGVTTLVLSSSLVACGGKTDDAAPSKDPTTAASTSTSPPSPPSPPKRAPPDDRTTVSALGLPAPVVPQGAKATAGQCTVTAPAAAVGDLPVPNGFDAVLEYLYAAPDQSGEPILEAISGDVCGTATDIAKCVDTIRALTAATKPATGGGWGCNAAGCGIAGFLVTTAGDKVQKVDNDGIVALYGPVSSSAEAALIEQLNGYSSLKCQDFTASGDDFDFAGPCNESAVHRDGTVASIGGQGCGVGRLPEGCVLQETLAGVGGWLATMAELERAAVDAFERMAIELGHHGAPSGLVARALEARNDEVRHARAMGRQAVRFGGVVRPPAPVPMHARDLEAMAHENAVEGCVRETFGAVVAAYQARTAEDASLRAELATIAVEEARHAQLSWDLAAWIEPLLDDAARARVDLARRSALDAMSDVVVRDADAQAEVPELARLTGLPPRAAAEALLAQLRPALAAA